MASRALDLPSEYVRLGLRFDRLESGFVDAYTGDPRLRAEVEDEPAPTPQQLRDQARALLKELDAAALPADRADFLRGQLTGLECSARKMSGEPVGFVDEVACYFQVDVVLGDENAYAAAHAELDVLLPGSGTLAERYAVHRRREECPPDRLARAGAAPSRARRGVPAGPARERGARAVQRAARHGAGRVRPAGGRDGPLRGGHRQAVVGLQLLRGGLPLPGRLQLGLAPPFEPPAASVGARVLSRPPHR